MNRLQVPNFFVLVFDVVEIIFWTCRVQLSTMDNAVNLGKNEVTGTIIHSQARNPFEASKMFVFNTNIL